MLNYKKLHPLYDLELEIWLTQIDNSLDKKDKKMTLIYETTYEGLTHSIRHHGLH